MDILSDKGRIGVWYGNDDIKYLIERDFMTRVITSNMNLATTNGLDIGCGKRKSLPTAVGIDKARGFAETGLELLSFAKPNMVYDAKELPFKDETIDWITSAHCIEHFDDPIAVINEWLRVLKKGGILSLIIPLAEFCGKIGDPDTDMTHKHDYDMNSFKEEVVSKLTNVKLIHYEDTGIQWSFVCALQKRYNNVFQ